MRHYHKIQTVFKRDPDNRFKTLLDGEFSIPEFEYLKDNPWVFTEKVDGTNIRIMFSKMRHLTFGGKSDNAMIPAFLLNRLNDIFLPKIEQFNSTFMDADICFYGEGYGAKIQKGGGNYRPDQDFVLFDVKVGDWWLQRSDVEDIANEFKLDIVPVIGEGTLLAMIEYAKNGFNSTWGEFSAEGIVARPKTELSTRSGHRIITKIKNKDFQ